MWTNSSATRYLDEIELLLDNAGYSASILKAKERLNILLTPIKPDYDFDIIACALTGSFTLEDNTYITYSPMGGLIDFHFTEQMTF